MPLASKVSPRWGDLSFLLPAGQGCRCCSTSRALTSCFSNFIGRYRASTSRAGSMNVYRLWLPDWKHCESNKPPSELLTLRSRNFPSGGQMRFVSIGILSGRSTLCANGVQPWGVIELGTEFGGLAGGEPAKRRSIPWSVSSSPRIHHLAKRMVISTINHPFKWDFSQVKASGPGTKGAH